LILHGLTYNRILRSKIVSIANLRKLEILCG
jgi:hypothetical protein